MCFLRQLGINIFDRADRSRERTAVVVTVERVQQGTVLTDQCNFGCGRTRVDTEIAVSFVSG